MRITLRRASLIGLALLLAVVAGFMRADDSLAAPQGRTHPAVQTFAQAHPDMRVPVIMQTFGAPGELARKARESGGANVSELGVAGGIAASLTPQQLYGLASDSGLKWISLDSVMLSSGKDSAEDGPSRLATTYPVSADAVPAWNAGITGEGVTVAVIDSGLTAGRDFAERIAGSFSFTSSDSTRDDNGHGTYVTGIIAGHDEKFSGIAPEAQILSLKVSGKDGAARVSDAIRALQWVVDHKDQYDIRVVNISLNSSIPDSYRQDPLDAAVEQAWLHGIVVVTAAGNFGTDAFSVDHAPANDPYVITAGAFNDNGTGVPADDSLAPWSSRGVTADGFAKPELVAPGVHIVSTLAKKSLLADVAAGSVVQGRYIDLSGTSASAAVVSGAVTLLLQQEPNLTPDQVKFRLLATAGHLEGSAAPRVDAFAATSVHVFGLANQTAQPNDLLNPATGAIAYDSVLWHSVLWHSVLWNSVLWSSIRWSPVWQP